MSAPEHPVKPQGRFRTAPARVLVVDASANLRAFVRATLCGAGHSVIEAADAHKAFDQIMAQEFDLVIADLGLSPMSGYELVAAIGLLPAWRRPRIIVWSDTPPTEAAARNDLRRVDQLLPRPVNAPDLVAAVWQALTQTGKITRSCGA